MKRPTIVVLLLAPCLVFANAPWNGVLKNVEVNPRINVVHVDTLDTNTYYYFLAAIPMAVFHYSDDVYSSLLITDYVWDQTISYLLDDWETYLDQHPSSQRHANFVGGVPEAVQDEIRARFAITNQVDTITGTPIEVAQKIAAKDWSYSEYVVIGPYKPALTDGDIESISNAAAIASLLNAPLLFTDVGSISEATLLTIGKLGASKAILLEINDVLSDGITSQLSAAGVTVVEDLTTTSQVVNSIRDKASRSTLCAIVNRWQSLAAGFSAARYGGYVLFLPQDLNTLANELHQEILKDPELQSFHKLEGPIPRKEWLKLSESQIAQNFYSWLESVGGNDPDALETVITFEPQGTGGGSLETTFERAISGDPSEVTRPGAISGRMPLNWFRNIALMNRTGMYRAMIFANPRPYHVTLAMNAYEVRYTVDTGSPVPDSWGSNHIVNEMFGWPYRGWCAENDYFPWDDIHSNAPDLSPILPPADGDGADHDPGQFASFLSAAYEAHFHSGRNAGTGSHPAQPDVGNIGFVQDIEDGVAFLYFSCHGGGTSIAVRNVDNGIAQDAGTGVPNWGDAYWPDDDQRVFDGSSGGSYNQSQLDSDLDNAHGMMIAYNACSMANGYMNEILLEHGGAASLGSYTSVSFTGSGWWWNVWVSLVTQERYTVGEAKTYASARVSNLFVPTKGADNSLRYVLYGDPNCPFVQTDWISPVPAPIDHSYGGHRPDGPAYEFAGSVVPDTVQINTPTIVTVTLDTAGVGVESVFVTVEGWGVSLFDTTDSNGQVVFDLTGPYGELLSVGAEKEEFDTYLDSILVIGGADFGAADISVSVPEIGLTDTLTPFYEGTITGTTDQTGFEFYAKGCGVDTSTVSLGTSADLIVLPTSTGVLKGVVAKTGFNTYTESIPVLSVYGTLSGAVVDSSTMDSLSDVTVVGYIAGSDTSLTSPAFAVMTNQSGVYTVPFELAVGEYDIYVALFGYQPFRGTKLVMHSPNTYDILLAPAPSALVYGWVKESGTMNPLLATIEVYRTDSPVLYIELNTDTVTGEYEVSLPHFTYEFRVSAPQHIPTTQELIVDVDSLERNFELDPAIGNILVINDDDGSKVTEPKVGKWDVISDGWKDEDWKVGQSSELIAQFLTDFGYNVSTVQAAETDAETWFDYDFIIWSCGKDGNPVSDSTYRSHLIEYANSEGKLLIEGGEITFKWVDADTTFAREVLHSIDFAGDNSGNLNLIQSLANHPIANVPNSLPPTIGITYTGYGDQDASTPARDAYVVYDCTDDPTHAGILVYDGNESPQSGQIVFYSFDFKALSDTLVKRNLLQNTADFLLTEETPPNCWISGRVDLVAASSDSGTVVTASSGAHSYSDTTGPDGGYFISLYPGLYSITARHNSYRDSTLSGVLTVEGQVVENIDFKLYPLITIYFQDFDESDGGFIGTGDWEWGIPQSGPQSAHSPPNLWATILDTNYSLYSDSKLETPELFMSDGLANPMLSFWHWYDIESNYDGGNVKISVNNGPWEIVDPTVPYPEDDATSSNAGIPGERCYSGGSHRFWEEVYFDLTPHVQPDDSFQLRFHFGSDGSVVSPGWYIDDVVVSGVDYYTGIGVIRGQVVDLETMLPLESVLVSAEGHEDVTNANGDYSIDISSGIHTVEAVLFGYNRDSVSGVSVAADETVTVDFALTHPEIVIEPASFVLDLAQECALDTSTVLSNPGNGELTYEIDLTFVRDLRSRKGREIAPDLKSSWLVADPLSGSVGPSASDSVSLHFNASGLSVDSTYRAVISVRNNTASGTLQSSVSMTVKPPYACGDCNGDGRADFADALYLKNFYYQVPPGSPSPLGEGDVNLDGRLTFADALYIKNWHHQTPPGSPAPCQPPLLDDRDIRIDEQQSLEALGM